MAREHKRGRYENGADKERRILNRLKRDYPEGVGARSAGSHSIIDVWFLDPVTHTLKLIQSKLGKLSGPERARILEEGYKLSGLYLVKFELIEKNVL